MTNANQFDVIIIGTGAGGGTLAHHLAPSGKRILILERGDYVPREKDNWNPQAVNVDGKYNTKELWRDKDGKALHPHTNYYVGGNTKFYGAALFRLRQQDFGEMRHHGGISPAWPISLRGSGTVLHAGRASVSGARQSRRRSDRAASRRSLSIPGNQSRAAHPATGGRSRTVRAAPFPCRRWAYGSMKKILAPSPCIRCNTCDGFPCLVDAKSDAQVLCVDPALRYPNVTLLTNALVKRLETDASGQDSDRSARGAQRQRPRVFCGYRGRLLRGDQFRRAALAFSKRAASERSGQQL